MKKTLLNYYETDHNWFESVNSGYGISNDDSMYLPKNMRKKTWSVISKKTGKLLFTGKTRMDCKNWVENKTGKKIIFKK